MQRDVLASWSQPNHWRHASAQVESKDDASKMLSANTKFKSIFERLPMPYFLGMCDSKRNSLNYCTLEVHSKHFKCNLQINAEESKQDCYLQVYGCTDAAHSMVNR